MHDVTRHFDFFRLSGDAMQSATSSWYGRFRQLPGGDVNKVPAHLLPVWRDLPAQSAQRVRATPDADTEEGLDEVENPVVNPITVRGIRSATDVNADEAAWHRALREGTDAPHPPLFSRQYLLATVNHSPLALHRVLRCKAGREHARDITVITSEYVQEHAAEGGFLGTFEPKMDPQYTGRGLKFLRHDMVERKHIKVYST